MKTRMKSRWIIHNDNRIFIADYSELDKNLNAVRVEIAIVIEMLNCEPSDIMLALTDVTCAYVTYIQSWINILEDAFPKADSRIKKCSIIGFSERRRYLLPLLDPLTNSIQYRSFN